MGWEVNDIKRLLINAKLSIRSLHTDILYPAYDLFTTIVNFKTYVITFIFLALHYVLSCWHFGIYSRGTCDWLARGNVGVIWSGFALFVAYIAFNAVNIWWIGVIAVFNYIYDTFVVVTWKINQILNCRFKRN